MARSQAALAACEACEVKETTAVAQYFFVGFVGGVMFGCACVAVYIVGAVAYALLFT